MEPAHFMYPEVLFVHAQNSLGDTAAPDDDVDDAYLVSYVDIDALSDLDEEMVAVYVFSEVRRVKTNVTLEDPGPKLEKLDMAKVRHPAGGSDATG